MNVWDLIDTYFRDNPDILVRHHMESYNDFILKGIPRIFKENNPVVIMQHQIENTTEYERQVRLYIRLYGQLFWIAYARIIIGI